MKMISLQLSSEVGRWSGRAAAEEAYPARVTRQCHLTAPCSWSSSSHVHTCSRSTSRSATTTSSRCPAGRRAWKRPAPRHRTRRRRRSFVGVVPSDNDATVPTVYATETSWEEIPTGRRNGDTLVVVDTEGVDRGSGGPTGADWSCTVVVSERSVEEDDGVLGDVTERLFTPAGTVTALGTAATVGYLVRRRLGKGDRERQPPTENPENRSQGEETERGGDADRPPEGE